MKRIFKDFRNISDEHMLLIRKSFPTGFSDSDLSSIKTSDGNYIEVLEIKTTEASYIFRMNNDLLSMIDEYNEKLDFSDELLSNSSSATSA